MAYKFDLIETIKTMVLAPAVAGLSGFATLLVSTGVSNLPSVSAYFTPTNVLAYAVVTGVTTFAIVIVDRVDKFLIKE
jgi:hypothetical protein